MNEAAVIGALGRVIDRPERLLRSKAMVESTADCPALGAPGLPGHDSGSVSTTLKPCSVYTGSEAMTMTPTPAKDTRIGFWCARCTTYMGTDRNAPALCPSCAEGRVYQIKTTDAIEQEWDARLPNETQPEFESLFTANPNGSPYEATLAEVQAIKADCAFMLDPLGPNLTAGERNAYAALLRQCCKLLGEPVPTFAPKLKVD